ncbi:MAG TPA: GDSL-type esterase/lipase family protein [Chitinophagales bacterium]|nr:GDSL-type esterase/lipase family protein [Chitinophagales bacterium]
MLAALFPLAILEVLCAAALRLRQGEWLYTKLPNHNFMLFEPHPQWVGVPRKNAAVTVRGILYLHNSQGFRGDDVSAVKTKKRIICIGGSTTYGMGTGNHQTWPYYLDSLLSEEHEVLNFGIPGHSTAEHKKLLPDVIRDYSPDIIILQTGLNDLRCMNVKNLSSDYANFHQPTLYASFGFCPQQRLPRSGLITAGWIALRKLKLISCCPFHQAVFTGTVSDSVDKRVVEIFRHNLDTLIRQCTSRNIPVILLPNILSPDALAKNDYRWWVPYLTVNGIISALDTLNAAMQARADGNGVFYFNIRENWSASDFYDASHLNAQGNLKLARAAAVLFSEVKR